jgi:beta-glucosidase
MTIKPPQNQILGLDASKSGNTCHSFRPYFFGRKPRQYFASLKAAIEPAILGGLFLTVTTLAPAQELQSAVSPGSKVTPIAADGPFPPVDRSAPYTPTVIGLMAQLSLAEKLSLVYGGNDPSINLIGNVGYLPGVPRLGIPVRRDADALGIQVIAYATALPTRLGMGATFDRRAVYAAGQLVGNEGRALQVDLVYGPQVDLCRLPNWGRNDTTYGEDPYLSGQLGTEESSGIQSRGLMSTVKHFAFYNGQLLNSYSPTPGAPSLPTLVDDQTAHELYLKAYEYPVTEAKPSGIMASYQGFYISPLQSTGFWASDNPLTLTTILRKQWGFGGFTLSDYGATHSVHALLSGLDQDFVPQATSLGQETNYFETQLEPLVDPTSTSYNSSYALTLNDAVAHVLYGYERFGLLEGRYGSITGYRPPPRPNIEDIKGADAVTTEQVAEEAAVLLKNENNLLPLKSSDLRSVAVIGPTARQVMVDGGQAERARGFPNRDAINPLQVLQALAPFGSQFTFAPGIDWIGSVVPPTAFSPGLTRTESDSSTQRIDPTIDYDATTPSNDLKPGVTYTWTGKINVPATDTYYFWMQTSWLDSIAAAFLGTASVTLTIDKVAEQLTTPGLPVATYLAGLIPPRGTNKGLPLSLSAGSHIIVVKLAIPSVGYYPIDAFATYPVTTPVTFRLTWSSLNDTVNAAVAAARSAKIAIVFADDYGSSNANVVNSLAPNEDALIDAVAKANPNTVVVLSTGDPVLMPWINEVKGLLEVWYPGQEGGTSTAKLLLGLANPGGKLPISWPVNADQTPFAGHPERINGNGTVIPFSEGLYMGYRWYDQQKITPQFPFGHGLSYTRFSYSDLDVRPSLSGLDVSFTVRNTGKVKGSEAPQIYVGPPSTQPAGVQLAPQKLVGFDRIELNPGQDQKVNIQISDLELSYWSTPSQTWILPDGVRNIFVGASSRDIRLNGRFQTDRK